MTPREQWLQELRYEYGGGTLVPFLGSGMSRPVCRGWVGMVTRLEQAAGLSDTTADPIVEDHSDDFELTRRASAALERLRLQGGRSRVVNAVYDALLESGPAPPTDSTTALARYHWPLVLTTNYDDLYVAAVHQRFLTTRTAQRGPTKELEKRTPPLDVVGRSPADCHRVLSALRWPASPLLWALQGFLPGQANIVTPTDGARKTERWIDYISGPGGPGFSIEPLERDLVVGHAEYRAVAMRSDYFRRAFAEVYRSRSLLFLGSGLRDRYLLDLFSQIAELYGASTRLHYAVVGRKEVDVAFMRRYFGISVLEIDDPKEIPGLLARIESGGSSAVGARSWGYVGQPASGRTASSLNIVSAPLRPGSALPRCVVVSGGGSGSWPRLSRGVREFLVGAGVLPETFLDIKSGIAKDFFCSYPGKPFVFVPRGQLERGPDRAPALLIARARLDSNSPFGRQWRPIARVERPAEAPDRAGRRGRDLRLIKPVMDQVLYVAAQYGYDTIVSTLLASGSLRSFPSSFVLQEMVRAWAAQKTSSVSLEIRAVDDAVVADLRSGRLDLAYLLQQSGSSMRFWVEIHEGSRIQRILERRDSTADVRRLLGEYWLDRRQWLIDVWPPPCLEWRPWSLDSIVAWEQETGLSMSLERLGLLHGSTLQIAEPTLPDRVTARISATTSRSRGSSRN